MSAHLVFWCFEIPIFVQLNGKISGNIHPFLMCFITSFFISWSFPLHFILFNVEESNFFFIIFMKFYQYIPYAFYCTDCSSNIVIMAWQQTVIFVKHSDTDVEGDPVADADCMPILLLSEGQDKSLTVWDSSFVQHSEDCQCWL